LFKTGIREALMSMDIYSHLMPNMQSEAAAAVDGVLRAAIAKANQGS
jgi:hypothetical protein